MDTNYGQDMKSNETIVVSIGQPGGLIFSQEKGIATGSVKAHHDMVELNDKEYEFWMQALEPLNLASLSEFCKKHNLVLEDVLNKLEKLNLIEILDKNLENNFKKISSLVPCPTGMAWGSNPENLNEMVIASAEGTPKVSLTSISFAIWTLFDRDKTFLDIYKEIKEIYKLDDTQAKKIIVDTFILLMKTRLIFVDY